MPQDLPAINSLDDVRGLLDDLPPPDETAANQAKLREPELTKPPGSLARLEDISVWLSSWQGKHPPTADKTAILVFAASHGVAQQGVSAFPAEVTAQMVANFEAGGAAINQLCRVQGADLSVTDVGVDTPTGDFSQVPAMSDEECAMAVAQGMAAVNKDWDVIGVGEMGIGNTTATAAISHALFEGEAGDWVGPGTGVVKNALGKKVQVVADSVALHRSAMIDGLEVLRLVGGRELAAMAGAILAARLKRIPVVLDGYVCGAAAAVLESCRPGALDHCIAGHMSAEPAHRRLLEKLNKPPLITLGMRLGEGSGAAIALGIVKAAAACHSGMATFAEAGVSDKS